MFRYETAFTELTTQLDVENNVVCLKMYGDGYIKLPRPAVESLYKELGACIDFMKFQAQRDTDN